jgi:hypothetical protein
LRKPEGVTRNTCSKIDVIGLSQHQDQRGLEPRHDGMVRNQSATGGALDVATPIKIPGHLPRVKGLLGWRLPLNPYLCIAAGTIAGFPRDSRMLGQSLRESAVRGKQIKFQSESLTAAFCLGVVIAGVSTLIGIGLVIVFA